MRTHHDLQFLLKFFNLASLVAIFVQAESPSLANPGSNFENVP